MSSQHLRMFIEESRENLDLLEAGLVHLETQGGDEGRATVHELFRFAHNLKGMAATEGHDGITALAHRMEDLLDLFRSGASTPSREAIDELLAGTDALAAMLDQVPAGMVADAPGAVLTALDMRIAAAADASLPSPAAAALRPSHGPVPQGACRFDIRLVTGSPLPGARAAILMKAVENAGAIVSTSPDREEILSGRIRRFTLTAAVADPARVATELAAVTDVEAVEVSTGDGHPDPADGPDTWPASDGPSPVEERRAAGPGDGRSRSARQTVRVDVERLDHLMKLVGELVIERGRLDQRVEMVGDRELADVVAGLSRTVADLQTAVVQARMVTLDDTFTRLHRLVRETSRRLGKDVALTVSGSQIELDRSVVDRIADPLVHLLRNALDHGIETPGARLAQGKPAQGRISLDAHIEGNEVIIAIADDGAGIDTSKVVEKAIAQGIVTADQASRMDSADERSLIFLPGFSTRDAADAVSGRGVGMDVVRSSVADLGGSVEVESTPGVGSTFLIRLPLSLAVLQVLLVTIGGQVWAVPLPHVAETISVSAADLGGVPDTPIVNLRGDAIGLIHGDRAISGGPVVTPPFHAVVFRHGDRCWALSVDELLERTEVVARPAPEEVAHLPHVAAATVLGDGRVSMILDPAAVAPQPAARELRDAS